MSLKGAGSRHSREVRLTRPAYDSSTANDPKRWRNLLSNRISNRPGRRSPLRFHIRSRRLHAILAWGYFHAHLLAGCRRCVHVLFGYLSRSFC
jgi:hypothetical protein